MKTRHLGPLLKGALVGLAVGVGGLFSGDMPHRFSARLFHILSEPVSLFATGLEQAGMSKGNAMAIWLVLHFIYWMTLCAFIGWTLSVLYSKFIGDPEDE